MNRFGNPDELSGPFYCYVLTHQVLLLEQKLQLMGGFLV